jgi:hypothetical protein
MTAKREELGPEPEYVTEHHGGTRTFVNYAWANWHRKRADAQAELLRRGTKWLMHDRYCDWKHPDCSCGLDVYRAELDKQI